MHCYIHRPNSRGAHYSNFNIHYIYHFLCTSGLVHCTLHNQFTICLPADLHDAATQLPMRSPAEHRLHRGRKRSSFASSRAHFTACPPLLTWASSVPLALLLAPFGCEPAVSMRRSWGSDALLGACWNS